MAKENLTTTAQINVRAREIDFVTRFASTWQALYEILGIMRPIEKVPGTQLKSYRASAILEDGAVGEGEEIPYSLTNVEEVYYEDLELEKYAKAVSVEAVNKYGAANAITRTDAAFRNELVGKVMDRFYTFLQTGTLTSTETTLQMAISMAIGLVKDKFKKMRKDATQIVVFVNTLDVYRYIGTANISIQSAFGLQYVKNFLGADVMIISSEIPAGKVFATPFENIDLYYINPANSDFRQLGLDFTTDGITNLIGFHSQGKYSHAIGESFALMGMKLWAEYLDGIANITIGSSQAEITLNKTAMTLLNGTTGELVAAPLPASASVTWASSDTSVATVSNGTVTAVKGGICAITATNGTSVATCIVQVIAKPSIKLDKATATVAEDATVSLTATAVPSSATVTWASSDETKATVSNGTVTGVAAGTATITASITENGKTYKATCAVTVTAE